MYVCYVKGLGEGGIVRGGTVFLHRRCAAVRLLLASILPVHKDLTFPTTVPGSMLAS